jgi:hypothetical protein
MMISSCNRIELLLHLALLASFSQFRETPALHQDFQSQLSITNICPKKSFSQVTFKTLQAPQPKPRLNLLRACNRKPKEHRGTKG